MKLNKIYSKVWGRELWITNTELYCGKILYVEKGYRCSYHHHKIKDETFHILSGYVEMKVEGQIIQMIPGASLNLPPGTKHSFAGITDAEILEISTQHFENDSYREDSSGKISIHEWSF